MIAGLNKKHFAAGFALGFVVALLVSGIVVRGFARAHREPERFKARVLKKMKNDLKLDEAQYGKASAILDAKFAEMRTVRDSQRDAVEKLHFAARAEIREVLDEEQRAKFDAFTKKMDERRARRRGARPAGPDE